jgi:hypothetical protein
MLLKKRKACIELGGEVGICLVVLDVLIHLLLGLECLVNQLNHVGVLLELHNPLDWVV